VSVLNPFDDGPQSGPVSKDEMLRQRIAWQQQLAEQQRESTPVANNYAQFPNAYVTSGTYAELPIRYANQVLRSPRYGPAIVSAVTPIDFLIGKFDVRLPDGSVGYRVPTKVNLHGAISAPDYMMAVNHFLDWTEITQGTHGEFQPRNFVESLRAGKVVNVRLAVYQESERLGPAALLLIRLIDQAALEYPDTEIPIPAAITAFAEVMMQIRNWRTPSIGISSKGAIWCEWSSGAARASLSVWGNGQVSFGMIAPDPDKPWRKTHSNRSGSIRTVLNGIIADQESKWLLHNPD